MKKKIFIIGARADGHPLVVLDTIINNTEYKPVGFIDENKKYHNKKIQNISVLGGFEKLEYFKKKYILNFIIATGDGKFRLKCGKNLIEQNFNAVNIIDNRSIISRYAELGKGLSICANAIIAPGAVIDDFVLVNHSAIIDHNVILQKGVTISPGVKIGGRVTIKEKTFVGLGAIILPDIVIGKNCIIGAGAVVLKNIPDNSKVVGNPMRFI